MTLCSHHHRLLHEGGFSVARNEDGQFRFFRPDGRPLEARSRPLPRFRGSAGVYGHAQATATADPGTTDRDDDDRTAELIAIHSHLGLDIDSTTALTRWTGERMDYSLAIEWMYSRKHGTSMA